MKTILEVGFLFNGIFWFVSAMLYMPEPEWFSRVCLALFCIAVFAILNKLDGVKKIEQKIKEARTDELTQLQESIFLFGNEYKVKNLKLIQDRINELNS